MEHEALEANPWILGIGLGGQLLESWSDEKLEQVVVSHSIEGVGKRTDALLRTVGIIRAMVFAEIKHHRTPLLGAKYRSGCWAPSLEFGGALVQIQQTVYRASAAIGDYLADSGEDGGLSPTGTFLVRPRSYLLIGSLDQLTGAAGGPIPEKYRSFELLRRNLYEPEVLTFDELLARAEWHLEMAERVDPSPPIEDTDDIPF